MDARRRGRPPEDLSPIWLQTTQVCRLLGRSRRTLMRQRDQLPIRRLEGQGPVRWHAGDVERLADQLLRVPAGVEAN